jgi:hypothetical protein
MEIIEHEGVDGSWRLAGCGSEAPPGLAVGLAIAEAERRRRLDFEDVGHTWVVTAERFRGMPERPVVDVEASVWARLVRVRIGKPSQHGLVGDPMRLALDDNVETGVAFAAAEDQRWWSTRAPATLSSGNNPTVWQPTSPASRMPRDPHELTATPARDHGSLSINTASASIDRRLELRTSAADR